MCDLDTYKCSDEGLLLPLINEYTWDTNIRAFVYLLGLLWSFMGVSIIADIFMQAIEMITRAVDEDNNDDDGGDDDDEDDDDADNDDDDGGDDDDEDDDDADNDDDDDSNL
ncbi:hypothetical protein PoB_003690800 [Plakobranchus ocellatus]|uniref:Uncharacterized protein n=1 Tax=Plakobranchus ocellatus TaxID=259542 RepID=A0AAV4ASQ0_9GAST|nr:hypothetical protein PoB_003690800 [Plakobranchus ocellatus]